MLQRCGEQFRRRYMENQRLPPGVAALVGLATDDSVSANLKSKLDGAGLLPPHSLGDIARDALNRRWETEGVLLDPDDDRSEGDQRGEAVDKAVRLSVLHGDEVAPRIRPTSIQRSWSMRIHGVPFDLAGVIDIQEGRDSIRDTKTTAKAPTADAAEDSLQLTFYSMAVKALDGEPPLQVALDYLIDRKTGTEAKTLWSRRNSADYASALNRIEIAAKAILAGTFVPANPDAWWCSPRWCGYYNTCRYVRRTVTG